MNSVPVQLRRRALGELFVATILWGLAFVTTIWALRGIGPIWMTAVRFVLAVFFLDFLFRARLLAGGPLRYSRGELVACFWPGFFLFALLTLQSWGLKYTTATKCGFITVLYVLLVPFLERVLLKRRLSPLVWIWIALALAGTGLICGAITSSGLAPDFLGAFNVGDGLTLLCAFGAAGHLLSINRVHASRRFESSPVKFHVYQCVWVSILAAITAWPVEGWGWFSQMTSGGWDWKVWAGMFQLSFLSSAIAFLILVRAQRYVSPTTAGLMVLLESPWAMVFSVILLGERLTGLQLLGAGLILVASVAECIQQSRQTQVLG